MAVHQEEAADAEEEGDPDRLPEEHGARVPEHSGHDVDAVEQRADHRAGGEHRRLRREPAAQHGGRGRTGRRRRALEPGGNAVATGTRRARAMTSAVATVGSARPFFT